jgi:ParB-like chromosome segregation protein Spo0J
MKTNPKFQQLIPPLAPEELAQLESNLVADGCRDPLVTWEGTLLDGHNRLAICERLGIKFDTRAIKLPDENAAMVWIIHNQFGRRNLTPFTRVELALKLEPLLRVKAKENQATGKSGRGKPLPQNSAKADTRRDLAKASGVSHDTIAKGKIIAARASEEIKAALRRGETSINAEHRKLTVHVGQNSGENEWYTPAEFIEAARLAMGGIDCDPASSAKANETVKAKKFFGKEQDGLKQVWSKRTWLNPPYARPLITQFTDAVTDKFKAGEIEQACVLVNNATETEWFGKVASEASAICFPSARVRFLDPAGNPGAPLQGQAILYLGKRRGEFCKAFAGFGFCVHVV